MADGNFPEMLTMTQQRFSSPGQSLDSLLAELDVVRNEAERLLEGHEIGDRELIACTAGCRTCCVVNVSVALLEGTSIARFVRRQEPGYTEAVMGRLDRLWSEVRGLADDERLMLRKDCAFLDARGWCGIYPVRPLICRGVTSTDPEACRQALAGEAFGETRPVLMHRYQQQLYETLFLGMVAGLEQAGCDGRSFQLTGLVRYLLNNPGEEEILLREGCLDWETLYP